MGFSGLRPASGPFFLAPGAWMEVWLRRNTFSSGGFDGLGSDLGAQWIMANPLPSQPLRPGRLTVSNMTKELTYRMCRMVGGVSFDCFDPPDIVYTVTVTNTGRGPITFDLQGGGNT